MNRLSHWPAFRVLAWLLPVLALTGSGTSGIGQIPVGLSVTVQTFSSQPDFSEWSGLSLGGDSGSGAVTTESELEAQVQTITARGLSNTLRAASFWPPAQYQFPEWNSRSNLVSLRAANNWVSVLVARLRNVSGAPVQTMWLGYRAESGLVAPESLPGLRVFSSLTGESNSWRRVAALGQWQTGQVAAVVHFHPEVWRPDSDLYLVWADDNGAATDTWHSIDDVELAVAPVVTASVLPDRQVEFSWPGDWPNFQAESTTNLNSGLWDKVLSVPTNSGGRSRLTLSNDSSQTFFRLREQVLLPP